MTAIIIVSEHHGMLLCFYHCFSLLQVSLLFPTATNERLSLGKDKQLILNWPFGLLTLTGVTGDLAP